MPRINRDWYTIYSAHDDEVLALGTLDQCAKTLGRSRSGLIMLISNVKTRRNFAYTVVREDLSAGRFEVYGADNRGKPGDDRSAGRHRR